MTDIAPIQDAAELTQHAEAAIQNVVCRSSSNGVFAITTLGKSG